MIEYKDFTITDGKLYLGDEYVGELVQDAVYRFMYYTKHADGTVSKDFCNLDRAWDNLRKDIMYERNQSSIQIRDAEKPVYKRRGRVKTPSPISP